MAGESARKGLWASALENFLHVKCLKAEVILDREPDGQHSETASEVSEGALLLWTYDIGGNVEELPLPSYIPRFNDIFIEWVYVIDLDREIFSVDHGAHFKMGEIPKTRWMHALAKTYNGDRLLLPDLLPDDAITSLAIKPDRPNVQSNRFYEALDINIVSAKGISGFHPNRRQEPLLCTRIFQVFQRTQLQVLATFLLGWKPEDFPFREVAFTILCLASGRENVLLVQKTRLADDDVHGCVNLTRIRSLSPTWGSVLTLTITLPVQPQHHRRTGSKVCWYI